MTQSTNGIIMYTSNFCGHSWAVERFFKEHDVSVKLINIDGDPAARQKVMALNNGHASVPTIIFSDGDQLTEPSLRQLRARLGVERPGLLDKVRGVFGRN